LKKDAHSRGKTFRKTKPSAGGNKFC